VDFFEDEATTTLPPPPPTRHRPDRRRTRIQRLVIGLAVLFVIIFLLAWWLRSCQHNRKVDAYRSYLGAVTTAVKDSDALGKKLKTIIADPTKYSHDQLKAQLADLVTRQDEIATRVSRLDHPGSLSDEAGVLNAGMQVRTRGFALFRKAVTAALGKKKPVKASSIAALDGYFSGPDAYYMSRFYTQTRTQMKDDGVSDVPVPTSTWYLSADLLNQTSIQTMLDRLQTSSKTAGIHGVALVGVTVLPSQTELARGKSVPVPADPDLSFSVTVENQGNVEERKVPVEVTLQPPGSQKITRTATIAVIASGQKQSVDVTGFAIPPTALSKTSTLKVKVGPVPEERVLENNSATYRFLLQLK
jgi:hypothetical protein